MINKKSFWFKLSKKLEEEISKYEKIDIKEIEEIWNKFSEKEKEELKKYGIENFEKFLNYKTSYIKNLKEKFAAFFAREAIYNSIPYAEEIAKKIKFFDIYRYRSLGDPNFKDYESLKRDAREIISFLETYVKEEYKNSHYEEIITALETYIYYIEQAIRNKT